MKKKIKKVITHPLFSGSTIMIGGSLTVNIINYFYHLLMGRMLGPTDYGTLASVFAIVYIISIIPQSSSVSVVKFISSAKNDREISEIFNSLNNFVFKISLFLSLFLLVISSIISNFLHISFIYIAIIAPFLFFSLWSLIYQSTLQGMLKFWGVVGPSMVSGFFKLLFGVAFILIGWSVFGALFGVFLASVMSFLYAKYLGRKIPTKKESKSFKMASFLKFSIPVLIQALAFTSIFTVDLILVKHFLSPEDAGLYAALSVLGKIIFFAAQPVTSVMFPIISGKRSKGENYRSIFYLSFFATVMISFTAVLFYYLFPNLTIGILFGNKYLQVSKDLSWMGMYIAVFTTSYLIVNFVLSLGKVRIVLLPFITAMSQILSLSIWHKNILQVIQVSLINVSILFICLMFYLTYNQYKITYAKAR